MSGIKEMNRYYGNSKANLQVGVLKEALTLVGAASCVHGVLKGKGNENKKSRGQEQKMSRDARGAARCVMVQHNSH